MQQDKVLDLLAVVFMGPSLLWFSPFLAVLAGLGHIPLTSPCTTILFLNILFRRQIAYSQVSIRRTVFIKQIGWNVDEK